MDIVLKPLQLKMKPNASLLTMASEMSIDLNQHIYGTVCIQFILSPVIVSSHEHCFEMFFSLCEFRSHHTLSRAFFLSYLDSFPFPAHPVCFVTNFDILLPFNYLLVSMCLSLILSIMCIFVHTCTFLLALLNFRTLLS